MGKGLDRTQRILPNQIGRAVPTIGNSPPQRPGSISFSRSKSSVAPGLDRKATGLPRGSSPPPAAIPMTRHVEAHILIWFGHLHNGQTAFQCGSIVLQRLHQHSRPLDSPRLCLPSLPPRRRPVRPPPRSVQYRNPATARATLKPVLVFLRSSSSGPRSVSNALPAAAAQETRSELISRFLVAQHLGHRAQQPVRRADRQASSAV